MNPRFQRASHLYNRGDLIAAEAELRAAMAAGDDSPETHALLGLCLLGGGLTDRAEAEVRAALERGPNCAFAHHAMSHVHQARAQFKKRGILQVSVTNKSQGRACLKSATEAVALAPGDHRYLTRLGEVRQLLGQWHESLEPLEAALARWPGSVWAAVLRAEALVRTGRRQEARSTLERTLQMNPAAAAAHAGMGWAMIRAGDHRRAKEFFEEALRLNAKLAWAQEGALECAKRQHRLYRWLVFAQKRRAVSFSLGRIALVVAGTIFLVIAFAAIDPFVRPVLGEKGTASLFSVVIMLIIFLSLNYQHVFLWLVRRQKAAKTTIGEARMNSAKVRTGLFVFGIVAGTAAFALGDLAKSVFAGFLGLVPGLCLFSVVAICMPPGIVRGLAKTLSILVLAAGPVLAVVFRDTFARWNQVFLLVLVCAPVVLLAAAIDRQKERRREHQHDSALEAAGRRDKTGT